MIRKVDELAGEFTLRFHLGLKWFDSSFLATQFKDSENLQVKCKTLPIVSLANCNDLIEPPGPDWDVLNFHRTDEDLLTGVTLQRDNNKCERGELTKQDYLTATFRESFELQEFPFDVQALSVVLRMFGTGVEQTSDFGRYMFPMYHIDQETTKEREGCMYGSNAEWTVFAPAVQTFGGIGHKQHVVFTNIVQRKSAHYIRTIVVPLFGLTSLTFIAFMLEPTELNDR